MGDIMLGCRRQPIQPANPFGLPPICTAGLLVLIPVFATESNCQVQFGLISMANIPFGNGRLWYVQSRNCDGE